MQQHKNSTNVMESATIQKNEANSKSPTSRRHLLSYFVIAALSISAVLTSCGSGIGGSSYKIKMTTEKETIMFNLKGSGVATVDWGDGSEKVSLTLNEDGVYFEHTYPNASIRNITINGDNITGLLCNAYFGVTNLNVSRCTELTELYCVLGAFTSLDVSKNTALTNILVESRQFTVSALNALFETLHSNSGEKIIVIYDNPGANDCDRSIAERKGWTVR